MKFHVYPHHEVFQSLVRNRYEGFPNPHGAGELEIFDIHDRNLESLSISVGGGKSKVSLYARAMEIFEGEYFKKA